MTKNKRFKIVYMGTPLFSVPALEALLKGPDEILAVVTQPDKPRGRGRKILPTPVKEVAIRHGLKLFQPEKVSREEFIEEIRRLKPDLLVVCAFGQILPQRLLDVPGIMPINIHGSLLPKYRGAAPIQRAILNGEKETGITIMRMDAGMDTGPMLLKRTLPINEDTTFGKLSEDMAQLGARALMDALDLLEKGELKEEPQPDEGISYAPPIKKEELKIDWNNTAQRIHCQIRAFDPFPCAYSIYDRQRVRVFSPKIIDLETNKDIPGTVLETLPKGIVIQTGKGTLMIQEIQWPGKKRLKVEEFLRGRKIPIGSRFS